MRRRVEDVEWKVERWKLEEGEGGGGKERKRKREEER